MAVFLSSISTLGLAEIINPEPAYPDNVSVMSNNEESGVISVKSINIASDGCDIQPESEMKITKVINDPDDRYPTELFLKSSGGDTLKMGTNFDGLDLSSRSWTSKIFQEGDQVHVKYMLCGSGGFPTMLQIEGKKHVETTVHTANAKTKLKKYQLPTSSEDDPQGKSLLLQCNRYANKVANELISKYNVKFKVTTEEKTPNGTLRVPGWDAFVFYGGLGGPCGMAYLLQNTAVKDEVKSNAVSAFSEKVEQVSYGLIPIDAINEALKNSFDYGYSIRKDN